MFTREQTRPVRVGNVVIGGGAPVAVQSMTNTDTRDVQATVAQIKRLEALGCDIVRASVNDQQCAAAFRKIKDGINIPLVADIHFSADLAVLAVENGADKLSINPGNIGSAQKVKLVADAASRHGVPIRVGVNAGSLNRDAMARWGVSARAMVESALEEIRQLEQAEFEDIVISMKASDVPMCVEAYTEIAKLVSYPLHLGITEAGGGENGLIKSAAGLGAMLLAGIGDTIRVSLTGAPEPEVGAAYGVLRACGVRYVGVEMVSCPTCGRTGIDVEGIARQVEAITDHIRTHIKVAVMGCAVNGPGEAREADVGIAAGDGQGVLFRHGEIIRKLPEDELLSALLEEIVKIECQKAT